MIRVLPILFIVALVIGIYVWLRNAATVARVAVDEGRVHVKRGALSASQRRDLQEAVRFSRFREGTIRLYARRDGLGVAVRPGNESLEQRLRNIVGTWRLK